MRCLSAVPVGVTRAWSGEITRAQVSAAAAEGADKARGIRNSCVRRKLSGGDPVNELAAREQLNEPAVTVEVSPAFSGELGELEDHGERRRGGPVALGLVVALAEAEADRCERRFDRARRPQMQSVLRRELEEGQERDLVFEDALDGFRVLRTERVLDGQDRPFGLFPHPTTRGIRPRLRFRRPVMVPFVRTLSRGVLLPHFEASAAKAPTGYAAFFI